MKGTKRNTAMGLFATMAFALLTAGILLVPSARTPLQAASVIDHVRGMILLQVERNGEAWYVHPSSSTRFFLSRPTDAFNVMRFEGLGITNADLAKIPVAGTSWSMNASLRSRVVGRILLQVEENGEAWYVYPRNEKRYYLGRPADAFALMRQLGLGITNSDLNQITKDPESLDDVDPCGNAVGNGNTVISGPTAPSGGDYDQAFRSLTVDPVNPNKVYVGTERNGVVYSADGGQTWVRYRSGIRHIGSTGYTEMWDMAIVPNDPAKIFLAANDSPGPLTGDYPSSVAGVYRSTNSGQTWTRSNCGLTNAQVASIVVDPTNASILLAGSRGGVPSFTPPAGVTWSYYESGLYRSADGGTRWTKLTLPGPGKSTTSDFWQIHVRGTSPVTYYSFGLNLTTPSENVGFIKSTDGVHWTALAPEHRTKTITDFGVSADGQVIIGSVRDANELIMSTDGGASWTSTFYSINGVVAISPADSNRVLYATHSEIWLTTDRFASSGVQKVAAGAKIQDIAFAPSDPNIVYAIASGYLLYRSTNAGDSFTLVKNLRSSVLNVIP